MILEAACWFPHIFVEEYQVSSTSHQSTGFSNHTLVLTRVYLFGLKLDFFGLDLPFTFTVVQFSEVVKRYIQFFDTEVRKPQQ